MKYKKGYDSSHPFGIIMDYYTLSVLCFQMMAGEEKIKVKPVNHS